MNTAYHSKISHTTKPIMSSPFTEKKIVVLSHPLFNERFLYDQEYLDSNCELSYDDSTNFDSSAWTWGTNYVILSIGIIVTIAFLLKKKTMPFQQQQHQHNGSQNCISSKHPDIDMILYFLFTSASYGVGAVWHQNGENKKDIFWNQEFLIAWICLFILIGNAFLMLICIKFFYPIDILNAKTKFDQDKSQRKNYWISLVWTIGNGFVITLGFVSTLLDIPSQAVILLPMPTLLVAAIVYIIITIRIVKRQKTRQTQVKNSTDTILHANLEDSVHIDNRRFLEVVYGFKALSMIIQFVGFVIFKSMYNICGRPAYEHCFKDCPSVFKDPSKFNPGSALFHLCTMCSLLMLGAVEWKSPSYLEYICDEPNQEREKNHYSAVKEDLGRLVVQ